MEKIYSFRLFSKDIRFMGFMKRKQHVVKAISTWTPTATNKVNENENET